MSTGTAMGSAIASPVVVASWITSTAPAGGEKLDLLVLWRGTPGWFKPTNGRKSAQGGSSPASVTGGPIRQSLRFGDVDLEILFDARARVAQIQGRTVSLGNDNAVLVDKINESNGFQVVKTASIAPQSPGLPFRFDDIFRRAPELFDFLGCAITPDPHPEKKEISSTVCDRLRGR